MLNKKEFIIVGITIRNIAFLDICVAALQNTKQNIFVIIHNSDIFNEINPEDLKKYGFKKNIHCINSDNNGSQSRIDIVQTAKKLKIKSKWIVFCDETDILVNLDKVDIASESFAILQNSVHIYPDLKTVLTLIKNPNYLVDEKFTKTVKRPNFEINGTFFKFDSFLSAADKITSEEIPATDNSIWAMLKSLNANSTPIYMDRINYIHICDFDFAPGAAK